MFLAVTFTFHLAVSAVAFFRHRQLYQLAFTIGFGLMSLGKWLQMSGHSVTWFGIAAWPFMALATIGSLRKVLAYCRARSGASY
ncbi:MAG: hypothetical protein AB1445_04985 [Bacillota bacterium]